MGPREVAEGMQCVPRRGRLAEGREKSHVQPVVDLDNARMR